MSDVSSINSVSSAGLTPLTRASHSEPAASTGPVRSGDKVELSRAAQYISKLISKSNDVRQEKVDQVKAEIAAGTYETPEKVDAALEELMKDL